MKQKIFHIILVLSIIAASGENKLLYGQIKNIQKLKTVVIDPGHGGSDPGAVGKTSREKDIVLKVSLKLGDYIKENFKDVNVVYTRTDDRHVELYKRAEIANKNHADLFISIHVNSFKTGTPYGTETFVMGTSKNAANLQVAKLENSAILTEENYQANYDGFDPNDPENHIIFSLYQNANLTQSLFFAQLTQENFTEKLKRFDRGVKQAGFLVLWKTTMPSVLVELGFISNAEEEKYLNSAKGQEELAISLFDSFVAYKSYYDGENYDVKIKPVHAENKNTENNSKNSDNKVEATSGNKEKITSDVSDGEKTEENIEKNNGAESSKIYSPDQIVYKIQIKTSPEKIELIPENFKSYQNVSVYLQDGIYKYTIGEDTDYNKIIKLFEQAKKDFKDCFIVKFKNGERI
ncbi:MAG: N-acetylmuramoyl-L-alanine amidase [Bacteroidales bacterium]|nr:N-acetylmuramoyl-L-alanine amidase [Bacteroidales bacterium]